MRSFNCVATLVLAMAFLNGIAVYSYAFTEDFDDLNAATRWTAFAGVGFDADLQPVPIDTNFDRLPAVGGVDGVTDDLSGFAFDYSTVGVPSAPNSVGGTTIGLKLQANLFSNALGGFSASPNNLNLAGNYKVSFDAWSNTVGPFPVGGSGSTNLSTFGILTSGTFSQSILSSDGVFFTYTADGQSAADFRAYSVEDGDSYQGTPEEPNAIYHAGSRNNTAALYQSAFGTATTVPPAQVDLYPADQTGTLSAGAPGFAWQQHEITKTGNIVEWSVNGFLLITVDMSNFTLPTQGGNISFGHADVNFSSSINASSHDLIFTLIDNIRVTVPEPGCAALFIAGASMLLRLRPRDWRPRRATH